MKFFKYSLIAALALSGVLSACDDDVKYSEVSPTPGVFFPVGENISKITIAPEEGEFDINVARYGFSEAQTYTFANNFVEGFSMPESVTFAVDETTATVKVNYDGAELAPGVYNLAITFAAGQDVNRFGVDTLKIAVTLPEPVEVLPWNDLGECTFTDPFLTAGFYTYFTKTVSCKVRLEESGETAGLYRLVAPYGTAFVDALSEIYPEEDWAADDDFGYDKDNSEYLYFQVYDNNNVVILPQHIALAISLTHGQATVMNDAGYEIGIGGTPVEDVPKNMFGVFKDGIVTLPARNALVNIPGVSPDNPGGIYYANSQKAIKMVVFPGVVAGDYSADVQFMGQFNNSNTGVISAVATAEFGEDVAYAKAGIVHSSTGANLVASIENGTYEAVKVSVDDPVVSLPVYMPGTYTIAYVTYDDADEPQGSGFATFDIEVYSNDDAAWEDLGYATFADGWLIGGLYAENPDDITDLAYDVLAQESKNVPGLYRFVNAFGAGNVVGEMTTTAVNTSFYIDATDPEFITIVPQFTGFTYGSFGSVYAFNSEGYFVDAGFSKDEIVAAGRVTTTFEDGAFFVDTPFFCGTGSAFSDGWALYRAGDYSVIFLPEEGEATPAALKVKAQAAKAQKTAKSYAPAQRKFKSSFKVSYKRHKFTKQVSLNPVKF